MGITIHYRGSLDDPGKIAGLTREVSDICGVMKWKFETLDDDWSKPVGATLKGGKNGARIKGNLGLKGICFQPHKNSEWVYFCCDSSGRLHMPACRALELQEGKTPDEPAWIFTKTQFAPAEIHVAIIKLLKHIKKTRITNLEVHDEGEYWETGGIRNLRAKLGFIARGIEMLEAGLQDLGSTDENGRPIETIEQVEQAILRVMGRNWH